MNRTIDIKVRRIYNGYIVITDDKEYYREDLLSVLSSIKSELDPDKAADIEIHEPKTNRVSL